MSDSICFESTIHGLEVASRMISRYAAFESLYTKLTLAVQSEVKGRLVSLYTQILHFLGNAVEYFSHSARTRLVNSVFQTSQNEELEKIAELDTEVDRLTRISDAEVQLQIQDDMHKTQTIPKSIQTPFSRVVDASTIYAKSVEEQQFRQLLTWMSSVPYLQHHARHSEARLQGSTEWLFKHPRYTEWNETSTSSILLLHGIPGSGKTSLTSSVVDSFLRSKSQNPLAAPVAYFYCGDSKMGDTGLTLKKQWAVLLDRLLSLIDKSSKSMNMCCLSINGKRRKPTSMGSMSLS